MLRSTLVAAGLALAFAAPAQADRLLIERAQASEAANLPARGQSAAWPVIHRWVYSDFTVYFERERVVDTVLNKAAPQEQGPAPANRG
jgi:hypothetical protein